MAKPKIKITGREGAFKAACPKGGCKVERKGATRELAGNAIAGHVMAAHRDPDYVNGNA
jgi:hypothetical protein